MGEINTFELITDSDARNRLAYAYQKTDEFEVIQLLSDLRYLPKRAFDEGVTNDLKVKRAVEKFRIELCDSLSKTNYSNLKDIFENTSIIEEEEKRSYGLSNKEILILRELTGLDKELLIHSVEIGKTTLLSRVLIYRYRVYDLIRQIQPNHQLTLEVIESLKNAAKKIGYTENVFSFGNLLADQERLSNFCISSPILTNNIFLDCIFISTSTNQGKNVLRELGGNIKRRQRFQRKIASESSKGLVSKLIYHKNRNEVKNEVDQYILRNQNIFLRRVLQVKLWTLGLYFGHLDHDFGPLSITALSQFLMTIVEKDEDGRRELGRIMYNLGNNQCIINIRYLISQHFLLAETSSLPVKNSSVSQVFDFVFEDKTNLNVFSVSQNESLKNERSNLTRKLKKEVLNEAEMVVDNNANKRRQYKAHKGIMKLFASIFKFVRNTFRLLKRLIQKLLRIVKKAAKIIFREVKEAFQNFTKGIKFLFGKRIIKPTPAITSDFDFDFDGITRIHSKPSKNDLKVHVETMKEYSSAIYSTLNFTRIVITWGIRIASGIGWIKILVGIAKLFREMIRNRAISQGRPLAIIY